jgi:hypothetical protein
MKPSFLWFIGGVAVLYFGAMVYALYRGRDVKASMKIPFAMFSFETKEPTGAGSGVPQGSDRIQ